MIWYPQLSSGSIAQLPLARRRQWRSIANEMESGERISVTDSYSNQVTWSLSYQDLSDAEVLKLQNLFSASHGRAMSFGFADPLANLLGWSEDLTRPNWQSGLLQVSGAVTDPFGARMAWTVSNVSAGPLTLQQNVGLPGEYVTCFSLWIKGPIGTTVALQRDSAEARVPVPSAWKRVNITGAGAAGTSQSNFGITLAAGQQIQMFGPQVEVQPYASAYKTSVAPRGIYEETTFGEDELSVVGTGPGLSSCQLTLISGVQGN